MLGHFDPKVHHRRSIRLKGYDYSQDGAYFVTMVTYHRACLLGEIVDGAVRLSAPGRIVQHAWLDLPNHYPRVELGAFIIMPNHAHGILILRDRGRRGGSISGDEPVPELHCDGRVAATGRSKTRPYRMPPRPYGLSEVIRAFISFSAARINRWRDAGGSPVWQRDYYEHINRNDREMQNIWSYIESNPTRWDTDDENPLRSIPP